jgi:hypothetical protein
VKKPRENLLGVERYRIQPILPTKMSSSQSQKESYLAKQQMLE